MALDSINKMCLLCDAFKNQDFILIIKGTEKLLAFK